MKSILAILTIFLSVNTWADWTERGNGGYAVKVESNYYLLDLVEVGLEDSFYAPEVPIHTKILERLDKIF